jgi:hypothetical protein
MGNFAGRACTPAPNQQYLHRQAGACAEAADLEGVAESDLIAGNGASEIDTFTLKRFRKEGAAVRKKPAL